MQRNEGASHQNKPQRWRQFWHLFPGAPAGSTSSTPEARALKSLLGNSAPALHLNKGTPSRSPAAGRSQGRQHEKKQCDLAVISARLQLHTQQLQPILLTLHVSTVMQLRVLQMQILPPFVHLDSRVVRVILHKVSPQRVTLLFSPKLQVEVLDQ